MIYQAPNFISKLFNFGLQSFVVLLHFKINLSTIIFDFTNILGGKLFLNQLLH